MSFFNIYGLLNPTSLDIVSENTLLCTLQYLQLGGNPINCEFFIQKCWNTKTNMYNNIIGIEGHDKYMSPDQIISLSAHSKSDALLIWNHLKSHFFTYDNITGKTNFHRIQQLQAVSMAAYQSTGSYFWCFVLSLTCIFACKKAKKEQTGSGALKSWTCFKYAKLKFTEKICNWIIGDWYYYFKIYYQESNHPIRKLIEI